MRIVDAGDAEIIEVGSPHLDRAGQLGGDEGAHDRKTETRRRVEAETFGKPDAVVGDPNGEHRTIVLEGDHNPTGPARTSGLDPLAAQEDSTKWGVRKPPIAAGRGTGGRAFDIVSGQPDASILLFRMQSTDPGVMMPELPRRLVDAEGVALIREWIGKMPKREP